MITYFWVIKFIPDMIKDERVNIGVAAISIDGSERKVRFVEDWSRANFVAGADSSYFLNIVANRFKTAIESGEWDTDMIDYKSNNYGPYDNVIFSQRGASKRPVDEVLEEVFERLVCIN
jgi:hypothetical protein